MTAASLLTAEACPDAVIITNRQGVIEYVNPAFEASTGYPGSEVIGRTPAVLKSGSHTPDFYRELWTTIASGRDFTAVFINRRKNGALFHEDKIIRPVAGPGGLVTHYISFGRDVSERAREMERLTYAATHDSLTGLPNRSLFLDRWAPALRLAARRGERFTLAMFDIDRFRDANTRFGHAGGDAVLQAVGARTRSCLRQADTVARIGGDEFAILLDGIGQRAAGAAVLDKIVAANAVPVPFEDRMIPASLSIGACICSRDASDADELRKRADEALYAAKSAGGNCYRFAV